MMHLKPVEFVGKIIIQKSEVAIKQAKEDISDLILWSDGSKREAGGAGVAVAWKSFSILWVEYMQNLLREK